MWAEEKRDLYAEGWDSAVQWARGEVMHLLRLHDISPVVQKAIYDALTTPDYVPKTRRDR